MVKPGYHAYSHTSLSYLGGLFRGRTRLWGFKVKPREPNTKKDSPKETSYAANETHTVTLITEKDTG